MTTTENYTTYAQDTDITFILQDTFKDNIIVSTEVIGFYYGKPDGKLNGEYKGKLKAEY